MCTITINFTAINFFFLFSFFSFALCRLEHILGSGEFGEVYKATWTVDDHKLDLAVKTLKSGASENDEIKFLQEAAIMGQFRHKNVIKMYGVVTLGEPVSKQFLTTILRCKNAAMLV